MKVIKPHYKKIKTKKGVVGSHAHSQGPVTGTLLGALGGVSGSPSPAGHHGLWLTVSRAHSPLPSEEETGW